LSLLSVPRYPKSAAPSLHRRPAEERFLVALRHGISPVIVLVLGFCATAAIPMFAKENVWVRGLTSAAFIALALWRLNVRQPVPTIITWFSLSLLLGALPAIWTGRLGDVFLPLTEAAFIYSIGGAASLRLSPRLAIAVGLTLSAAVLSHAIGLVLRHGLDFVSADRTGWNLAGWLAAVAGISALVGFPRPSAIALFLISAFLVLGSGSRASAVCLITGIAVMVTARPHRSRQAFWKGLAVLLVVCTAVIILKPNMAELTSNDRVQRSFTFDTWNRDNEWSYWVETCTDNVLGLGYASVPERDVLFYIHNAWLDIWVKGGLISAATYVLVQSAMFFKLYRLRRASPIHATALALFVAASFHMAFEYLPLASSMATSGFLVLFFISVALGAAAPRDPRRPSSLARL